LLARCVGLISVPVRAGRDASVPVFADEELRLE